MAASDTLQSTRGPRSSRWRWALAALAAALLVVASGCGSDDETVDAGDPNDQPADDGADSTPSDPDAGADSTPSDPDAGPDPDDDGGNDDGNGEPGGTMPDLDPGAPLPDEVSLGWLGLTSAEAEDRAAAEDRVLRVAREDDETFALTDDLGDGRVNINLDDGIVTFVWIESIEGAMEREGAEHPVDLVYVGLTEAEAEARGAEEGHTVRIISRDGEGLPATMDYRTDRRNLDVVDDIVVAVTRG